MDKQKMKKTKRRSIWKAMGDGLDKLSSKVGNSLPVRGLCRLGCMDENFRKKTKDSLFSRLFAKLKLKRRVVNPTKRYFASAVENSRVLEFLFRFLNFFYTMPVLYYGIMLFATGLTLCGLAALSAFMHRGDNIISAVPVPSVLQTEDATITLKTNYPFENRF